MVTISPWPLEAGRAGDQKHDDAGWVLERDENTIEYVNISIMINQWNYIESVWIKFKREALAQIATWIGHIFLVSNDERLLTSISHKYLQYIDPLQH